ncbi:MAG: efflux RND transporter periplasmic adaptor subunit [Thiocapsa sp.]|uniref:efflux RND transporter periplasmic adaptor subunit n=1 Tax=Thiocapsa sp. TaxID=2024551 RepID=UPI001BCBDDA3|nr:efflux RND transporter periplasmic adaptor subunit [Thiocapsa sp.]QVL50624.1 MAG: efflux RND transporter periplasmic adaptor subunit [Thiocapsa sp.]
MNLPKPSRRIVFLLAVLVPLIGAFLWLALTSGPLAPVPVTLTTVEMRPVTPTLFGVGTVEARYTYRIGPTFAGRVRRVEVQVGDRVEAGQLLGEMDPVDLDDRVAAADAALRRAESGVVAAHAQVGDAQARRNFASAQVARYEQLLLSRTASEDTAEAKRQEAQVAEAGLALAVANLESAEQDLVRVRAEREALVQQRANLRLIAPVDALVVSRDAEPGSTVVAGQSVVEVIDPSRLWIDVRFDQLGAGALRADLGARIALRSLPLETLPGEVLRIEPRADAVTEEFCAKIAFSTLPEPLPRLGELAEVTVALAPLEPAPALPNAALHRRDGQLGVWVLDDAGPRFAAVETGARDLEGWVQIRDGLASGDRVILHSRVPLRPGRRVEIVEQIPGLPR